MDTVKKRKRNWERREKGQQHEEVEFLAKLDFRDERFNRLALGTSRSLTPSLIKGVTAEAKFHLAWKKGFAPYPSWLAEVLEPSDKEDLSFGADGIMVDTNGNQIFVQIKSSIKGVLRFLEKNLDFKGVVIIIRDDDTSEEIRVNTLLQLARKRLPEWYYNRA